MSDEETKQLIRDMKQKLEDLEPVLGALRADSNLQENSPAEQAHYRSLALSESEGHALGREVEALHQRHSLNFARTVMTNLLTGSIAQGGISHYYKFLTHREFPWRLLIIAGALAVVAFGFMSNPVYSQGLGTWLGEGFNAYIVMAFVAAIAVLVLLGMRRRSSSSRQPVG